MKTIRLIEREDLEARYKAIINHDINKWLVLSNVSRIRTQKWLESVVIDDSRRDYVGLLDDQIFAFSGLTHINQLNRYMKDQFGRFGILITRNPLPKAMLRNTLLVLQ